MTKQAQNLSMIFALVDLVVDHTYHRTLTLEEKLDEHEATDGSYCQLVAHGLPDYTDS